MSINEKPLGLTEGELVMLVSETPASSPFFPELMKYVKSQAALMQVFSDIDAAIYVQLVNADRPEDFKRLFDILLNTDLSKKPIRKSKRCRRD
jgi:hypothetical protein